MIVKRTCPMCGKTHGVTVSTDEYNKWTSGMAHIQDAMPRLSATEREQLLSGLCPVCQQTVFDDGEE